MTDAMEIAVAIEKVAEAINALAKAHRSLAYEMAKAIVQVERLNDQMQSGEIEK